MIYYFEFSINLLFPTFELKSLQSCNLGTRHKRKNDSVMLNITNIQVRRPFSSALHFTLDSKGLFPYDASFDLLIIFITPRSVIVLIFIIMMIVN